MTNQTSKIAFLFPGQGSQYPGMGQDFITNFSAARLTFEEADDLLKQSLSSLILKGPSEQLTETKNSQLAIYMTSMAILRVVQEMHDVKPFICAGLSLGEYTALTAAGMLSFQETLLLVQKRAEFMQQACQETQGTMAAVIGLSVEEIEKVVEIADLPQDLWIANFNCPGQVVISGTAKGIEKGSQIAKEQGAKRVLPLQVSGAFHSGLMEKAEMRLHPFIDAAVLKQGDAKLVMNVTGKDTHDFDSIRNNLVKQVTHSVRWEQSIQYIDKQGIDLYVEFGPGKTLSAFNKRIQVQALTYSIEKVEDLDQFLNKKG